MIVQSLWVGDTLTDMEIYSIKSFLKLGYDFHLYTYNKVDRLPKSKKGWGKLIIKNANEIILEKNIFKLKEMYLPFADIWRYKLLYLKGGYWVDLDLIAIKDFHKKFQNMEYLFSSERTIQKGAYKLKQKYVPNIGVLKAPKGSPFYKEAYDISMEIQNKGKNKDKIKYMRIIRDLIEKYNYSKYVLKPEYFCHLSWWHAKDAYLPKDIKNPFTEKYGVKGYSLNSMFNGKNVYTIHLWRSLLVHKYKIDLNGKYMEGTLWEEIKKYIDN
jgi:hypothetical protein